MIVFLHVVTVICLVVFATAVVVRFIKIMKMPLHLRWEVYPVGHEKNVEYGGSYMEEVDWWTKPREVSRFNEMKEMIPEMLLLKGLWEHNRSLWYRSFPFHFGLYLLIGFAGLVLIGAIAVLTGGVEGFLAPGTFNALLINTTSLFGFAGLGLGLFGALGLLERRFMDKDLRDYTSPAAIFNLVFFLVALGVTLAAAVKDPGFHSYRTYVASLLTFSSIPAAASVPTLTWLSFLLCTVLVAYIPLTHMSHFFVKWFTWHKIRWDDEPNVVGGKIEKQIQKQLGYKVSWAAPHIQGGGTKTWGDIAGEGNIGGEKKESK